jgi:hypothetical protein
VLVVAEEAGFDVVEREGGGVELGAVVVGEHPLDVVVPVLQEPIILELLMQPLYLLSFDRLLLV